jgi:NADH-quinone oxidoreductase subunit L
MRNYGGLRKKIPLTFWAMMIGTLAITGVGIPLTHIGFAGFLSKDAVIESAYVGSTYGFWMLVIAAGFTSFYSWRLMFMTFYGESRASGHGHGHGHDAHGGHDHEPHESPMTMLIPLGVLALGATFAGMLWYNVFFGNEEKMRDWFAMEPAAVHHAGDAAAAHDGATAETTGEAAQGAEATATADTQEAAGTASAEPGHAAAVAPKGAVLILPYGAEEQAVVDARLHYDPAHAGEGAHAPVNIIAAAHAVPSWVKVSPFIAMLIGLAVARGCSTSAIPPAGTAGGAAAAALPVPAEQVVFRRDLRLSSSGRPAGWETSCGRWAMARSSTAPSTGSQWASSPSSPASPAGHSRAMSSPMPSPWWPGSSFLVTWMTLSGGAR